MKDDSRSAHRADQGPALAPVPFLTDAIRLILGESFQILDERTAHHPTAESPPSGKTDNFAEAVTRALQDDPVLAIPSWETDRSLRAPAVGQTLIEQVQLSGRPLGFLDD